MITTNALLKLSISLVAITMLASCMSFSAYQEVEIGNGTFSARPEIFQVDSQGYPVFILKEGYRQGPVTSIGTKMPNIYKEDYWQVTYRLGNRFLVHSSSYSKRNRVMECELYYGREGESCKKSSEPSEYTPHIYIRSTGHAYGWQHIRYSRNPFGKKSWFRIDDVGNWSGQPWFECVTRCDKLERMQQEEMDEPDPFGGPGGGRI
ncbi:hypothetical protein [Aidingimonas lacisalsi]|uniref:hypothetical protein n=1 Tax=Aidingimonas lacisalsi TaxID=2604086 RepID=UPI0011D25722|nr:hypothetical protein [Aidingimonas lacisalsi]